MSAVLAALDRPPAAAWRPGLLDEVVSFEVFGRSAALRPGSCAETLIVERCAAEIAAEAGASRKSTRSAPRAAAARC